jgi:molecular chaperone GrpE
MAKMNANRVRPEELDHELPPAEGPQDPDPTSTVAAAPAAVVAESQGGQQRLSEERDALFDRLARLQAEFENYRKRAQREQHDFREYAVTEAVKSLLPALDSLDLALKNSEGEKSDLHAGVELTRKQLQDALSKVGLREVPSTGQPFDPQVHQAIEMVDTADVPDHQVLDELQRGYKLKERLLRPAMVRVARDPHH